MLQSVGFSAVITVISIILFVFLCVKGLGPIISALLCTALISFVAIG